MPTVMLLVGALLCAALYLWAYFAAEAPKDNSLEWIGMYEKPKMTRQGLVCPLKWLDLLWSFLLLLLAAAIYIAPLAMVDVSILRTTLSSGWLLLAALPTALAAVAAYLLGKLLSGKFIVGLLPMLLVSFSAPVSYHNAETCLMLLCLLLTLTYLVGNGFWAWLGLILSGILLGITTWFTPNMAFFALPWLGTVLLSEILRMKREDVGPWHLILALLAATAALLLAITVLHFPLASPNLAEALKTPGYYTLFWQQLLTVLPRELFLVGDTSIAILLPSATLLLFGVIAGISATSKQQTVGLMLLLWSVAGLALAAVFPAAISPALPALSLAYLVTRIRARGYGAAAWVIGLTPVFLTAFTTIITIWRYVI